MPNILNFQEMYFLFVLFFSLFIGNVINWLGSYLPHSMNKLWQKQCQDFLSIKSTLCNTQKFILCQHSELGFFTWNLFPFYRAISLKGRCSTCLQYFPSRYSFTEMGTCLISMIIIHYSDVTWQTGLNLILSWALILLTIIDSEHFLLPDCITLPLIWLGLIANTFHFFTSTESAIFGTIFAYCILFLTAKIFKYLRGIEGLGLGDCKLFAVFGAWWGIYSLIPILLIASLAGSIIGVFHILQKKQTLGTYISFGPYLAFAGILTILSHIVK